MRNALNCFILFLMTLALMWFNKAYGQSGTTQLEYSYGRVDLSVTGVITLQESPGYTPKVLFLWAAEGSDYSNAEMGFGYMDADGNTASIGTSIEDNQNTSDTRQSIYAYQNTSQGAGGGVVMHYDNDGTTTDQIKLRFHKIDTDSIAVYADVIDNSIDVNWLALGGDAIQNYEVLEGNMPAANAGGTTTLDFGDPGFNVKMVIFLYVLADAEGESDGGGMGVAFIDSTGNVDSACTWAQHADATPSYLQEYGDFLDIAIVDDADATITSVDDEEVVIDWETGPNDNDYYVAIGIGGDFYAQVMQVTAAGSDDTWHNVTPNFEPEVGFLVSMNTTSGTGGTAFNPGQNLGYIVGPDSTAKQYSQWIAAKDNDPSDTQSGKRETYVRYQESSGGIHRSSEKFSHFDSSPKAHFMTDDTQNTQFGMLFLRGHPIADDRRIFISQKEEGVKDDKENNGDLTAYRNSFSSINKATASSIRSY